MGGQLRSQLTCRAYRLSPPLCAPGVSSSSVRRNVPISLLFAVDHAASLVDTSDNFARDPRQSRGLIGDVFDL
jgi:hypothetical protein